MVDQSHDGMSIAPEIGHHEIGVGEMSLDVFLNGGIELVGIVVVRKIGIVPSGAHLNET